MINTAEILAENHRLKERLTELERNQDQLRLNTFQKTLEVFLKQQTLCEILNVILEQVAQVIDANGAFIYLAGPDPDTLELRSTYGVADPYLHTSIDIHSSIIGQVWETRQSVINLPTDNFDNTRLCSSSQHYLAMFPMKNNHTIYGIMGITYADCEQILRPDVFNTLESFVNLATIASDSAQVNDALRNSRTTVNQITETIPDIVFIHDIQRKELVYLNSAFTRILGFHVSEFIGKPIQHVMELIHLEDIKLINDKYLNLLKGVREYKEVNYRMKDQNGNWHWFSARYQVFMYNNERPNQILGILQDITDRRQSEQQRIALQMERDRVELLRDFVRDASHSFRTPLATINTSVYLIRKVDTPENRDKHLDLIKRQVHLLDQLVDALLMMSRLDSGVSMALQMIDLSSLLHEIYHDLLMYDNNFDIVLSITGELNWLPCDRYWLYKALSEIVQNSLQHAHERIIIRAWQQPSNLHIQIEDDGDGINEQEIEHVFDRFYRGEKSRLRGGLGLGLSIARKVIAEHGGEISLQSKLGKGAVCSITLPYSEMR